MVNKDDEIFFKGLLKQLFDKCYCFLETEVSINYYQIKLIFFWLQLLII